MKKTLGSLIYCALFVIGANFSFAQDVGENNDDFITYQDITCSGNVCFYTLERCEDYRIESYDSGINLPTCDSRPTIMFCFDFYSSMDDERYEACSSTMITCRISQRHARRTRIARTRRDFTECITMREETEQERQERIIETYGEEEE